MRTLRGPATRWAGLGAALALTIGGWLLWASAVPYGEAPDEPSHVEVAQFIAAHGRLPVFGPTADAYTRLDQVGIPIEPHALAPPLPYLVGAGLIRLLGLPAEAAMRVATLLAALAAVAGTYALVRRLLPRAPALAGPVAALLATVPQVSFQGAVANSDIYALAGAVGVGATWPLVRRPAGALLFGVVVGLALLTKLTAYAAVTVAVVAAYWELGHGDATTAPAHEPTRRAVHGRLVLAAIGAAAVAGPWLARNVGLYGEPLPLRTSAAAFAALTPPVPIPGSSAPPLLSAAYLQGWAALTVPSLWATFGRLDLFAPAWWYALIAMLCAGAAMGLARGRCAGGGWSALGGTRLAACVLFAWVAACLLATVAMSTGRYFPPHGRYLLPALPPLVLALALGWQALLPAPARRWAPWGLVLAMVGLNLYCLVGVVLPRYYGPGSVRLTVTVDEPRPGALVGADLRLRGWTVVTGRERWMPGAIGGPPAWHARPAAVWAVHAEHGEPLAGGAGVARPDVARALATPEVAAAGFEFHWAPAPAEGKPVADQDDLRAALSVRAAAGGAAHRVAHLTVCASDPRAAAPTCVTLPVRVP
ncbi:MAG: glycosyltransferase family 39 protein [Chloroflexi bacterium]|nr:glycosyltransferase family 39 protein [Chloroflexota bacterium]